MAAKTKNKKSEAKSEKLITKQITLGEVVQKYPETIEVMFKNGLHCVGCHVAAWETIEQGALGHGINPDKLVEEMNKAIKETAKKKKKIGKL